uniref:Ig-like domain-containing protein n=1 Tax=Dicentrarchus labrax TaxID=13489 RepID=A0A8P4GR94_DICLA
MTHEYALCAAGSPSRLLFYSLFCLKLSFHALQVISSVFPGSSADTTRRLSVLVGTDVTLGCLFDKLSKLVEWSALTVEWNMVDQRAEKSIVYTVEDGRAYVSRDGFVVDKKRLLEGDASLQLRNVTVGDEGLYTLDGERETPKWMDSLLSENVNRLVCLSNWLKAKK